MSRFSLVAAAACAAAVAAYGVALADVDPPAEPLPQELELDLEGLDLEEGVIQGLDLSRISYVVGYYFGIDLSQQGLVLDVEYFADGIRDAMLEEGEVPSEEEIMEALFVLQMLAQMRQQEEMLFFEEQGREFLERNLDQPGIQVTESGLQYRIIEEGEGDSPAVGDIVTVHYEGRLLDGPDGPLEARADGELVGGTVFDSSRQFGEPLQHPSNLLISGWTEVLSLMKPGAVWQVFIPPHLGYGPQGYPPVIPPNSTLVFTMELLGFEPAPAATPPVPDLQIP